MNDRVLFKPDNLMTVGIKGGLQKHWQQKTTHFEIITGKSFSKTQTSKQFGFVYRCVCVLLLCLGFNQAINAANHIRDFYQEPGITPYRADAGYTDYESINPFSGILRLNVVDVSLPGNGGLDMNVSRHYKHPQGGWQFRANSQVGRGWSMHPGRLIYSASGTLVDGIVIELCAKIDPAVNIWDGLQTHERLNPAFETSDGTRQHFYRDRLTNNTSYISKENWRLHCEGNNYIVTSPDGVRYYTSQLSQKVHSPDTFGTTSWYVTRIQDVHNNTIDIDYIQAYENVLNLQSPWAHHFVMNSMTSNDGRRIRFNYTDIGTVQARLQSIQILNNGGSSPVKTWQYNYELFQFTSQPSSADMYVLTSVIQPDGTQWEMEHFPRDFAGSPTTYRMAGSIWILNNPLGGQSCYYFDWMITYEAVNIVSSDTDSVIWKVQNENRNRSDCQQIDPVENRDFSPTISGALWRYRYNREISGNYDVTLIEKPDGSGEVYRYRARFPISTVIGNYWTRAQLVEKVEAESLSVNPIRFTPTWVHRYSYLPRQLTDTDWLLTDASTGQTEYGISPMLVEERSMYYGRSSPETSLDLGEPGIYIPNGLNANIRTQSDFDDYGNPGLVFEGYGTGDYWSPSGFRAQFSRRTRYTYTNLIDIWKLGLPETTTVDNVFFPTEIIDLEPITNVYDPANGNLLSKNEYGITTDYTYHPHGELFRATDALGRRTAYWDYFRGVPRRTQYANFTQTSATVSNFGEALTITDARDFTTTYEYDPLSRITSITLPNPASSPVQINYVFSPGNNQTIINRGNYRGTTVKDGFGQVLSTTHEDITDANSVISQTMEYDVFKRKTFDSLPNSSAGTRYNYDFLDRVIEVVNPDLTTKTTVYDDNTGNRVAVTDELSRTTRYEFQSFGSPSDKQLINILSPENIQTSIYRDRLGRNLGVWQGQTGGQGYERTFTYNANNQLETETNPESGVTTYLYDVVGNVSSKQIGSNAATIYSYDELNRTELITYPGTTPSVGYRYDGNNNIIQVANSNSNRTYGYDQNNNLTSENINIDNQSNIIRYDYDSLDNLLTTTYPSFRVVDYSPDVFGQPTQAAPYINSLYYYPSGQLEQIAYVNGVVTDFTLDTRLRVRTITTAGLTPIADLVYTYDYTNNVRSIENLIESESQYNRTMIYDDVNRLTDATGVWGSASYNYDAIGNIRTKNIGPDLYDYTYNSTTNQLDNLTLNNQPNSAYSYDTYGNISGVTGQRNMIFNDAQNLIQATILDPQDSQTVINTLDFAYDGNNMRVSRNEGTETINYVYSTSGNLLAENNSDPSQNLEHFYLGSKRVATVKGRPSPVAAAGADQTVTEGATVTLDGSATTIPAGYTTTYFWNQLTEIDAIPLFISQNNRFPVGTFTLPSGVYLGENRVIRFRFSAVSSNGEFSEDDVLIRVQIIDTDNDGLSDIWEQNTYGDITLYDGNSDPDLDGYTNTEEYTLGLDPVVAEPLDETTGLIAIPEDGRATIHWKSTDRALDYDLYWSTTPGVTPTTGNLVQNVTSPYVHTGLSKGQQYYYIVVANNQSSSSTSLEQTVRTDSRYWTNPVRTHAYTFGTGTISVSNIQLLNVNRREFHFLFTESTRTRYPIGGLQDNVVFSRFNENTGWANDIVIDRVANIQEMKYSANTNTGNAILSYTFNELVGETIVTRQRFLLYELGIGWRALPDIDYPEDFGARNGPIRKLIHFYLDDINQINTIWQVDNSIVSQTFSPATGWSAEASLVEPQNLIQYNGNSEINVVMSEQLDLLLTWNEYVESANEYNLYGRYYSAQTGWATAQLLGTNVSGNDNFGRPHVATTLSSGGALVVWDDGDTNSTLVYSRTMNPDLTWQPMEQIDASSYSWRDWSSIGGLIQSPDGSIILQLYLTSDGVFLPTTVYRKVPGNPWQFDSELDEQFYTPAGAPMFNDDYQTHLLSRRTDYKASSEGLWYTRDIPTTEDECWANRFQRSIDSREVSKTNSSNTFFINDCSTVPVYFLHTFNTYWYLNGIPISEAGPSMSVAIGDTVILDGSSSTDDGTIVSYAWEQVSGPALSVSSLTGQTVQLIADAGTRRNDTATDPIIFNLTVTDDQGNFDVDNVVLNVIEFEPVASAGPDQTINIAGNPTATITLDGSASYDPNGTIEQYLWEQISGPATQIESPNSVTTNIIFPTFTEDATLWYQLTVTDDSGVSSADYVRIIINVNAPLVVDAGIDQVVRIGDTVQLLGSVNDPSGILRPTNPYSWRLTSGPVAVQISDTTIVNPTFVVPDVPIGSVFEFSLTARDTSNSPDSDTVRIIAQDATETDLGLPIVTPPANITLEATAVLTPVTLGSATANDPEDGVLTATPNITGPFAVGVYTIIWSATDTAGNTGVAYQTVTIQDTTPPVLILPPDVVIEGTGLMPVAIGQATATDIFTTYVRSTAPSLYPLGTYRVRWTATDANGNTTSAFQNVTVGSAQNQPPIASAGNDQTVDEGNVVTLSAAASSDPDGSIVSYQWQQTSGPAVALNNANTATASFTTPNVLVDTVFTFSVVVTDDGGATANAGASVMVLNVSTDTTPPIVTAPANITLEAASLLTTVALGTASANDDIDGALTPTPDQTGPFGVGVFTITWSASDNAGNVGTATQLVTITDTTAPALSAPADISIISGAPVSVNLGTATATDIFTPVTITNDAVGLFSPGITTVTWTATDPNGNSSTATQTVTVIAPNQLPIANAGIDLMVDENILVTLDATASNDPDGTIAGYQWQQTAGPIVIINAANTATPNFTAPDVLADTNLSFSVTVTDNAGDTATDSVLVTVQNIVVDTTEPVVTAPADITQEATSVLTPVTLGTASANDDIDGPVTATPDQTGPFALGSTVVTWSATDAASNTGTATQTITIEDNTLPVLTIPADVTVLSNNPIAIDIGVATATDIFTPLSISNDAPALFPVGSTNVTWTATDANGLQSTDTQVITVNLAPGILLNLGATSPSTVGTVVNLTASLAGLTGSYEYRFRIRGPATGNRWQTVRGYNTNASYNWNTSGYLGRNRVRVTARPVGTRDTPVRDTRTFWVNDTNAATGVVVSTLERNPQASGTPINISAAAEGGSGSYEYQFRVRGPSTNDAWVILQDYATNNIVQWDTTGIVGRHRVQVRARNAGSLDRFVRRARTVWLNNLDAMTAVTLTTTPASPQAVGTVVTLTGTPTGGNGTYEYQYRVRGPATGAVWQILQDWTPSNTYQWDTSSYIGTHRVQVIARNTGSVDRPVRNGRNFSAQ